MDEMSRWLMMIALDVSQEPGSDEEIASVRSHDV